MKRKYLTIDLSADDLSLLNDAFGTYLNDQLATECEPDPEHVRTVERIAARFEGAKPGKLRMSPDTASECASALEAHLYWEVSDPRDRNDGFVFWNPEEDEPGSKMARDDRDPSYVAECREVDVLRERFESAAGLE